MVLRNVVMCNLSLFLNSKLGIPYCDVPIALLFYYFEVGFLGLGNMLGLIYNDCNYVKVLYFSQGTLNLKVITYLLRFEVCYGCDLRFLILLVHF